MDEDDIQEWIDNKNVDFIYFCPEGYAIPKIAKKIQNGYKIFITSMLFRSPLILIFMGIQKEVAMTEC